MKNNAYLDYNDNELLYMIHQEDEQALAILIQKYHSVIQYQIKKYQKKGVYTIDDYYQLALIKLVHAIYHYREDKDASFHYYFMEIVRRSFIDHFRHCNSYNGFQEAYCISLDMEVHEEGTYYTMMDFVNTPERREHIILEFLEYLQACKAYLKPIEIKIINYRLLGYSYRQIAHKLNINEKKVDNTIRKIRNKKTIES